MSPPPGGYTAGGAESCLATRGRTIFMNVGDQTWVRWRRKTPRRGPSRRRLGSITAGFGPMRIPWRRGNGDGIAGNVRDGEERISCGVDVEIGRASCRERV